MSKMNYGSTRQLDSCSYIVKYQDAIKLIEILRALDYTSKETKS